MKLQRAIVTGPTGGVGVNLIEELVRCGVEVTAVCRPNSSRIDALPNHPLVRKILCELESIDALPQQTEGKYDAFFHLAWDGTFGSSRDDIMLQKKNLSCTLKAVRAAASLGCCVFVGAGSQAEYGPTNDIMSPTSPCKPVTGYGAAKLSAGAMSRVYCRSLGMRHVWCRILSMYGPHDGENTMVSSMVRGFLNGERAKCTAGEQLWDYIYAKDVARAFHLAAESAPDGAVYCLGSGRCQPLRRYIEQIRDAVNPALGIDFGAVPYYPNQVMHLEADISSLTRDTGFVPSYTFEQGIQETVAWMRSKAK